MWTPTMVAVVTVLVTLGLIAVFAMAGPAGQVALALAVVVAGYLLWKRGRTP